MNSRASLAVVMPPQPIIGMSTAPATSYTMYNATGFKGHYAIRDGIVYIDKDILEGIQKLKATIVNLEAVLNIRKQLHNVSFNSDRMLEKALQNFNETTNDFSRNFSIPRGMGHLVKEPKNAEEFVDKGVSDISQEIERLKAQLESIEV